MGSHRVRHDLAAAAACMHVNAYQQTVCRGWHQKKTSGAAFSILDPRSCSPRVHTMRPGTVPPFKMLGSTLLLPAKLSSPVCPGCPLVAGTGSAAPHPLRTAGCGPVTTVTAADHRATCSGQPLRCGELAFGNASLRCGV